MNASLSVLFVVFYHRMFKGHIHSCLGFSQSNKGRSKAFQTVYKTTIGTAKSYIIFFKARQRCKALSELTHNGKAEKPIKCAKGDFDSREGCAEPSTFIKARFMGCATECLCNFKQYLQITKKEVTETKTKGVVYLKMNHLLTLNFFQFKLVTKQYWSTIDFNSILFLLWKSVVFLFPS